jgi:hypothetical protein
MTCLKAIKVGSKTTLNYRMMVERYPNLKEEVGGLNSGCEISSLPDGKLVRWCNCLLCFGAGLSAFYLTKEEEEESDQSGVEIISTTYTCFGIRSRFLFSITYNYKTNH